MNKPIFIAEIKTQSMFGFKSRYCRETLIETALQHGDWISVHTNPRFGGSFDDIYYIRQRTNKPILAKGFHTHDDDVKKALDLGASYVLVVDRACHHAQNQVIHEFSNLQLFEKIKQKYKIISSITGKGFEFLLGVYNGRDLTTGLPKKYLGDYKDYRTEFKWLCGASLIKEPSDVQLYYPNCDAFIVGENLVDFCKKL